MIQSLSSSATVRRYLNWWRGLPIIPTMYWVYKGKATVLVWHTIQEHKNRKNA